MVRVEGWEMTITGKLFSAAAIGGAATYLMQGAPSDN
jgi:hypothetical protein